MKRFIYVCLVVAAVVGCKKKDSAPAVAGSGSAPAPAPDAPKGFAIVGDTLYVADITVVRRFDAKTGKQKDDIKIPGATFLNDLAADGAGGAWVSDTGMDASFKPTGTDAIWHIGKDGAAT